MCSLLCALMNGSLLCRNKAHWRIKITKATVAELILICCSEYPNQEGAISVTGNLTRSTVQKAPPDILSCLLHFPHKPIMFHLAAGRSSILLISKRKWWLFSVYNVYFFTSLAAQQDGQCGSSHTTHLCRI